MYEGDHGIFKYAYGVLPCNGAQYLVVKFTGSDGVRVTGSASLDGSGTVGGDITQASCQVFGTLKDCTLPPVTGPNSVGAAIQVDGGWGLGLGLYYEFV